ncbi:YidC/Oxa1 family membrane protein insertase, partial [Patescibacteria group bacterium]|nr:YidC/Oxa1 family membrane protein insertase [Patescibacteria group bacterium]
KIKYMVEIFHTILYEPIFNIFVGLYNIIPDVGIVILILTVAIKLALYPLTTKSIRAQKSLTDLQPKLNDLKEKYKGDQQALAQETMKLYKENKVNPLGSCLPILIQIPIFLALYWVLRDGLGDVNFDSLYSFVSNPGHINPISLGLVDLSKSNWVLALMAGGAQFWQAKSMNRKKPPKVAGEGSKDEGMMVMMNKQMLYFMPILTIFISFQLPGGVALYWFLSTFTMALQQVFMFQKDKDKGGDKPKDGGVIEGKVVE